MTDLSRALSVARKARSTGGSSAYDDMSAFIAKLRQEMAARDKTALPPIMRPGGLQGQQAQSTMTPRSLQAPTPIGPNGGRPTDQISDLGKLTNDAPQWAKDWFADNRATGVQPPLTNGAVAGDTKRLPASPSVTTGAVSPDVIEGIKSKIGAFESGNNYAALGKVINYGDSTDRAYGKYQVMGSDVGPWTKEALGTALTPEQFLKDPKAQEAVASYKMGQIYQQYGNPQDVASIWFSGKPASQSSKLADANGTTGADYVAKTVGSASAQPAPAAQPSDSAQPSAAKVGDWRANAAAVGITPQQMSTMTPAEQQQFMDPVRGANTATGPVPGAQGALDATTKNYRQDIPQPQPGPPAKLNPTINLPASPGAGGSPTPGPQASAQPDHKPDLAQLWPTDGDAQNAATGGRIARNLGGALPSHSNLAMDDQSRMQRAKSMGFMTGMPVYHGTNQSFNSFQSVPTKQAGLATPGVSVALDPDVANEYAEMKQGSGKASPQVYGMLHRAKNPAALTLQGDEKQGEISSTIANAFDRGHDAVMLKNYTTPGGQKGKKIIVLRDSSQLRSPWAVFDPEQIHSSDLLAHNGGRIGYADGGKGGTVIPTSAPNAASSPATPIAPPISMTRGWTNAIAPPISMTPGWTNPNNQMPTDSGGGAGFSPSLSPGMGTSPSAPGFGPIGGVSGTSGISMGPPSSAMGFANNADPGINAALSEDYSAPNLSNMGPIGTNSASPDNSQGLNASAVTGLSQAMSPANATSMTFGWPNKNTNSVANVSPEMTVAQTADFGNIGAVNSSVSAPTTAVYGVSASPATMSANYGISNTPSVSAMSPDGSIGPGGYGDSASTGHFGIGETGAVSGPGGAPVGGVGDGTGDGSSSGDDGSAGGDGGGWKKGGYVLGPRRKEGGYIDRALAKAFAEGGKEAEDAIRIAKGLPRTSRDMGGNIVSKAIEAANRYNPNLTRQALDAIRRVS